MKTPFPLRRRQTGTLVAALAVAGALGFGWRVNIRHRVAEAGIPERPVLTGWPAGLADEIGDGEAMARRLFLGASGLVVLGRVYHANGFFNEALQCYDALQVLEPSDPHWPHLQASILAGFGQLDAAIPLWRRAVILAPAYLPARLKLGDVLLKSNLTAEAAVAYGEVLQRDAGNPHALLGLARCALADNRWEEARAQLEHALKYQPDFVGAGTLLVTLEEHFNQHVAADALRAALGKRQSADVPDPWLEELGASCYDPYRLSVAASMAELIGDVAAARRWLERAIELSPESGSYHRELGKILYKAKDYSAARRQLEQAVARTPAESDAWALLVELLKTMGDAPAADRALAAGLAKCPQSPALHCARGERLSDAGRLEEAAREFRAAKDLRPNDPDAYVGLALTYLRLEHIDEAMTEFKGALAAQPDHPLAMEILARHAIDTADEPAARDWLRRLRQQPRVPIDDLNAITREYQSRFGHPPQIP